MNRISLLLVLACLSLLIVMNSCDEETSGCTDPNATNFNPNATEDDGSCFYNSSGGERFEMKDTSTTNGDLTIIKGSSDVDDTLYSNKRYLLRGFVYVNDGGRLFIEPGTVIMGEKSTKGSLVIQRGAQIFAEGTENAPIVFTSNQAPGSRNYGDWGGVILCGNAKVNLPGGEGVVEGGTGALFGGNDDTESSGVIKYVRIEFCGIPFQPNQEINGLTLAGIGTGTTVDYVQVSFSGDDSYEWFGGSVNAKHLIAFQGWDDDFDTDNGFSGKVQFVVGLRNPNVADASGSNGFESDNNADGSNTSFYTSAVFSNVSIFGPRQTPSTQINAQFQNGMHLRRNSRLRVHNAVITGYPYGIYVQHSFTEGNAYNDDLRVRTSVISGCDESLFNDIFSSFNPYPWYFTGGYANDTIELANLKISDPYNLNNPDFTLMSGSWIENGASFSHPDLAGSFFEQVNYIGAFGSDDWTAGWANWDPQNTVY